jgi:hypothetical protein
MVWRTVARMRKMAGYHARGGVAGGLARKPGTLQGFTQKVAALVGQARQRGFAPDSPEAAQVVGRLLDGRTRPSAPTSGNGWKPVRAASLIAITSCLP